MIEMLDEQQIHGLLYVEDAMLYLSDADRPRDAHAETLKWAESLPPHQRPLFVQVPNLAHAARDA